MAVTSFEQRSPIALDLRQPSQAPLAQLALWRDRAGFRRDLRRLAKVGDHMLRDIGMTPESAQREIAKPFWRA